MQYIEQLVFFYYASIARFLYLMKDTGTTIGVIGDSVVGIDTGKGFTRLDYCTIFYDINR